MEETNTLRLCMVHGLRLPGELVCKKCGRKTVLSDLTTIKQLTERGKTVDKWENREQFLDWANEQYPGDTASVCSLEPKETFVNALRSGDKKKAETALGALLFYPQYEEYLPDVVRWWDEFNRDVTFFLSRCSYERVKPYLDFKRYNHNDQYSVKLFLPLFLEHYQQGKPLPCEKCGRETNNLFIKIKTEKNEGASVRKGSWVYTQMQYTGLAVPHAYCDACALKKANKIRAFKKLPDPEKIKAWMHYNLDIHVPNCGDAGDFRASMEMDTPGFNYEYLLTPAAAEKMMSNEVDKPAIAAMIRCAQEIKAKLDGADQPERREREDIQKKPDEQEPLPADPPVKAAEETERGDSAHREETATIIVHWYKEKMGLGSLPVTVNGVDVGEIRKGNLQVVYHTNVSSNVITMGVYKAKIDLSPGDTVEYFVAGNGIRKDRTILTRK